MENKVRAIDVADFFVNLSMNEPEGSLTNLQVNKLIYLAAGCYLAEKKKRLFDDPIEAWDYGPVVRDVYDQFKVYGSNPIKQTTAAYDEDVFDIETIEFLIDCYNQYGQYSASKLVALTHLKDSPWDKVYAQNENRMIQENDMLEYFTNQNMLRRSYLDISEIPSIGYLNQDGHLVLPVGEYEDL